MKNEFTAVFERDGEYYIGYCLEMPGANGLGKTIEDCRQSSCCWRTGARTLARESPKT